MFACVHAMRSRIITSPVFDGKRVLGAILFEDTLDANSVGIKAVVDQQFAIGKQIIEAGLVPIIEPEVDINSPEKSAAEALLKAEILSYLNTLASDELVMLKLTLPEHANFYKECIEHPNVLKVVALSGGYVRDEANQRLRANNKMIASFSRALTEGLSAQQSDVFFCKATAVLGALD